MESVKEVLMRRDQMTSDEADGLIDEFRDELQRCIEEGSLDGAYDLIQDYFGLEPDYLCQFLFW